MVSSFMGSKSNNSSAISRHGGARPGAGRPRKEVTNAAYEAGWRYNPQRMWIYTPGADAKKELNSGTRLELLRKGNWLANNTFIGGAIEKVARLVGPLIPMGRSDDDEWNMETDKKFRIACCNQPGMVDLASGVNYNQAPALIVRQMSIAGDIGWQQTKGAMGHGMFRFIPGENIGSGNATDEDGWQDGVKVDQFGSPIAFRVLKSPTDRENFTDIPATDLRLVKRNHRLGYVRSPSWLARLANNMQDYSETMAFQKQTRKLGASLSFVITSPDAGSIGLGSKLINGGTPGGDRPVLVDTMTNGAMIPQLKNGEKIEAFNAFNQSGDFREHMDLIKEDVAIGFGSSAAFLFDSTDAGGANMRWVLEEASIWIKEIQDIIITGFAAPFRNFWIWNEIEAGRIGLPRGDEGGWNRCDFTPPADLSVDFSRDGRLMSDLLLKGQISPQRYFGLQGLNAYDQADDIIRFYARKKKSVQRIAEEEGVELTVLEVFPPAPGTPIPAGASVEGGDDENDDPIPAPEPKKKGKKKAAPAKE